MRAIVCHRYGSLEDLAVEEVETPTPKDGEVLIEVHAASVNAADWRIVRASPFLVRLQYGLFRPKVRALGSDLAGRVVAVGPRVTRFRPGDEVFGNTLLHGLGAFAELATAPEIALAPKPARVSFEQAAAAPLAGVTAMYALRAKGRLAAGQRVLIHGAAGGVGTFAVPIAKSLGAEVTAVCSASKAELVRSLGADRVIDYAREDFAASGERYDLILAIGGGRPIGAYRRALREGGTYVLIGGSARQFAEGLLLGPLLSRLGSKRFTHVDGKDPGPDDLASIASLLETGALVPVIDEVYPLERTADAIRHLESGRTLGKIVLRTR